MRRLSSIQPHTTAVGKEDSCTPVCPPSTYSPQPLGPLAPIFLPSVFPALSHTSYLPTLLPVPYLLFPQCLTAPLLLNLFSGSSPSLARHQWQRQLWPQTQLWPGTDSSSISGFRPRLEQKLEPHLPCCCMVPSKAPHSYCPISSHASLPCDPQAMYCTVSFMHRPPRPPQCLACSPPVA